MPNPGAFQGSRKDFLVAEKEAYSQAVDGNYTAEVLALIFHRYFKRYPLDIPHNIEPSPEHLAAVDDNAPDPEIPEPDIFTLSQEDYKAEMKKLQARKEMMEFRKSQIKRWLAYQYMKDHHVDPKETGAHNPFWLLMCKLTGRSVDKPRRKIPLNLWRKTVRAKIDAEVKINHAHVPKSRLATTRDKVAHDMFAAMPLEDRHHWEVLAEQEHKVAMEQWERDLEAPFSTDPADRQRTIQALVPLILPILDMVCDATGWKASFIAGGPEPAQGGKLNVISVHSGTTSGDVKMTFGHAERANIKKFLIPIFSAFLQKCYTPVECRLHALPGKDAHLSLVDLELDNQKVTVHSLGQKTDPLAVNSQPQLSTSVAQSTRSPRAPSMTLMVPKAPAFPNSEIPPTKAAPVRAKSSSARKGSSGSKETLVQVTHKAPARKAPIGLKNATPHSPAIPDPHEDTPTARPIQVAPPHPHVSADSAVVTEAPVPTEPPIVTEPTASLSPVIEQLIDGNPTAIQCLSEHDRVLAGESDTLEKTISVEEDEVEMTASRSISPAPSAIISQGPSPAPSRCPSPITTSAITIASDDNNLSTPAINGTKSMKSSNPSDLVPSSVIPTPVFVQSTNIKKRRRNSLATSTSDNVSLADPSAKRPKRTIIKTNKLILMEEESSRWGIKKRSKENRSNVEDATINRRRGGK